MSVTVMLLALGRALSSGQWQWTVEFITAALGNALIVLACAAVGLLITSRRPGNVIGWIYALVALVFATGLFAASYASRPLPGRMWLALLPDLSWIASIPLGATLLLLLYPTGRPPSPRWRPVVWAAVVATVVAVVASALMPGRMTYLRGVENPLGLEQARWVLNLLIQVAAGVIAAALFAAAGSLILRWRRARGVERQQLKWLAYAAAMLVVVTIANSWLPDTLSTVMSAFMPLLFPVATGIAVVRYRLYDIDRLINRTLVYGLLTALLAGVYAAVVLVLGQGFGGVGGDPPSWVVAGATLAVAALFQPARRRIQAVVDRRFNRRKFDAARTVEAFSARLRDEVDLDTLVAELLAVVNETVQPAKASLWLRPPTQM
jgi:MFS family permease